MRLKLVPSETSINFMGFWKAAVGLSIAALLASVVIFFTMGLNFGIDFRGGTTIEVRTEGPADISQIRAITGGLGLGDVSVQEFGQPNDVLIQIEEQQGDGNAMMDAVANVRDSLQAQIPGLEVRRIEVVGPKVSGELVQAGVLAVSLAILSVLVYVWLRFEWQFAVGAVMSLVHDVLLTIGIFSLIQLEFNLSIIAALLTIVGYSLNDTVIVFDRVRENLRRYKSMDMKELLNLSINETLSRTTMTSFTTLLALFALYFLGGEVVRGFTFGMIWGIFVGTYSSVFVASLFLIYLGVKRDWSKPDPDGTAGVQFGSPDAP